MSEKDLSPEQHALRQRLSDNLRRLRVEAKISQEDLADLVGAHRTYVSKVERMVANPTLDNLAALAKVLDVDALDLLAIPKQEAAGHSAAPSGRGGKRSSKDL